MADLRKADLRKADLRGANLFGADLDRAKLRNVDKGKYCFSKRNDIEEGEEGRWSARVDQPHISEISAKTEIQQTEQHLYEPVFRGGIDKMYTAFKEGDLEEQEYKKLASRLNEISKHIIMMYEAGKLDNEAFRRLRDYYDMNPLMRFRHLDL